MTDEREKLARILCCPKGCLGSPHVCIAMKLSPVTADRISAILSAGFRYVGPDEAVVPREATEKMIEAACGADDQTPAGEYRVMIQAAGERK